MPRDPSMRASDAEREQVAAALRDNLAEGRLTLEEFNERLEGAFASKTYGELDALLVDLPRPAGSAPATWSGAGSELASRWDVYRRGRLRRRWARFASVNSVVWVLWGASVATSSNHGLEGLWPLWLTVPWGAILLRRPWYHRYQRHCT